MTTGLDTANLLASEAMQPRPLPPLPTKSVDAEQARKTAMEFEAVYLSQMLAPMFQGLESDGYFGGGQAEKMYRSLLVEEYGKVLARTGGIGIADAVQREIMKLQEVQ